MPWHDDSFPLSQLSGIESNRFPLFVIRKARNSLLLRKSSPPVITVIRNFVIGAADGSPIEPPPVPLFNWPMPLFLFTWVLPVLGMTLAGVVRVAPPSICEPAAGVGVGLGLR